MSHQGEDGWYPECSDCGCGNLCGRTIILCEDCWKKLKKKYKIREEYE